MNIKRVSRVYGRKLANMFEKCLNKRYVAAKMFSINGEAPIIAEYYIKAKDGHIITQPA